MRRWTAILLAGQRPGADPLAAAFGETWKALVRVDGEAMLSRSARALLAAPSVDRVLVLAQEPAALVARPDTEWMASDPRVAFTASASGIARSVAAVAGSAAPWPVLVTTADHALLTPAMVEAFVAGVGDADVAAGVVERRTLVAAYPDNRRTWLRFGGGAYSGANLFALAGPAALPALDLWASVEADRKRARRILSAAGPWLLLRAATRTIGIDGAMAAAGRRLGFVAKPVVLDVAEAAIDVDKPSDHALAEAILRRRV